jgi:hypothetical protein
MTTPNTPITKKPREIATPDQLEGLLLMRMVSQNIKAVRFVDVTFDDTMTIIGGDNAQGKSSFLGGYEWLFGGRKAIGADADPIREGEVEGFVEGDFGDGKTVQLKVRRTFVRVGESGFDCSRVAIEMPGFITPSQRETFLEKLVNPIAVDPMAFDRKDDEERAEIFKKLVAFDFKANKTKHDAVYALRADVNRDLKREQGALASLLVADVAPCDRIDEAAIVQELQDAGTANADIVTRKNNRAQAEQRIATLRKEAEEQLAGVNAAAAREMDRTQAFVDDCERQIKALQQKIELARGQLDKEIERIKQEAADLAQQKTAEADQLQKRLDEAKPLGDPIDVDAIRARLNEAQRSNRELAAWQQLRDRRAETQVKVETLQTESDELTAQLTELEQAQTSAIQKAHLPIDGLGFKDGAVTLNGKPWKQASEAERIDASMALAMALSPKLRNIIIRDASGVGSKIKQRITDRARAKGYRVVLEILDESGANSTVLIENGLRKPIPQKSQEAAA